MAESWLTLVTVTKNDPAGLERTLASARALRAAGIEHVVIDGSDAHAGQEAGSSDPTANRVITEHRAARGIADAFNAGLARSRGEWVWFLNGGDAVHEALDPAWLQSLLATTRAHVVTGAVHYDGEAEPRCPPPLAAQWPLLSCWLAHPATMVRRETLVRCGGFDERLGIAMDYDLWQRLLRAPQIVDVVAVPFARFDMNGMSQRPELRRTVRREEAIVLLRHASTLTGALLHTLSHFLRRMVWAALRRFWS